MEMDCRNFTSVSVLFIVSRGILDDNVQLFLCADAGVFSFSKRFCYIFPTKKND